MDNIVCIEQVEKRVCRYEVALSESEFARLQAMPGDEALAYLQEHEGLNVQDERRNQCPELVTAVYCDGPSGAVDLRRQLRIPSGREPKDEVLILTDTGVTIAAPAYPCDCYYVRLLDDEHNEIGYWDNAEWKDDPQVVMGAIVGAICAGA